MNIFDSVIIDFINQFSRLSWTVDNIINFLSDNHLVKGGLLVAILWWGWFRIDKNQSNVRVHIISTLLSCFVAMVLAKALALTLPSRLRPLHEEGLNFLLPYNTSPTSLEGVSSFPSDHAVLFYTLSTGLFFISRKIGIFALVYTTLFIGFPRVYLCLHYPTDIIGGAIIGIIIGGIGNSKAFNCKVSQPILQWSNSMPGVFYPMFFLITYQIVDIFNSSRAIIKFVYYVFQNMVA